MAMKKAKKASSVKPAKKTAKPTKKSVKKVTKPAAKKAVKPTKKAVKPAKKTAKAKPVKKAVKKVSKKVTKSAAAKKAKPVAKAKKAVKPAKKSVKKVTKPAAKKAAKPVTKKVVKKAVKPVVKKAAPKKQPVVRTVKPAQVLPTDKETLSAAELTEIKEHLLQLKEEAMARLKDKKNMDMPEAEVGDDIDNATRSLDKEILFELSGNAHNTIEQIESALRKIEKGIYGKCEYCRQPIPKKRIKALPFARYCVHCQSSTESSAE